MAKDPRPFKQRNVAFQPQDIAMDLVDRVPKEFKVEPERKKFDLPRDMGFANKSNRKR